MESTWKRFVGWSIIGGISSLVVEAFSKSSERITNLIEDLGRGDGEVFILIILGMIFGAVLYGLLRKHPSN